MVNINLNNRAGGVDFRSRKRQRQLADQQQDIAQATANDQATMAAAMADRQTVKSALDQQLPVEELQSRMAQPSQAIDPQGFRGTAPENMAPADLQPYTEIAPTPEQVAEATQDPMYEYVQQGSRPDPAVDRVRELTPSQKGERFISTLEEQAMPRGVIADEEVDDFSQAVDPAVSEALTSEGLHDNSMMKFSSMLDGASNMFDVTSNKFNLLGTSIDLSNVDQEVLTADPQRIIFENSDAINFIIRNDTKLNLSEDPTNPNSKIRKEAGRAAFMATILALSNKMALQSSEVDEEANKKQHSNGLNRNILGPEVGRLMERFLFPTQMDDPAELFKGVSEGFGYNSRMTPEEQSLLGQAVLQGFADSKIFNFVQGKEVKDTEGKKTMTFVTTREGDKKMRALRRGIRSALGIAQTKDRPVSLTRTDQGMLRGEGASTQKRITAAPEKNFLTKEVQDAIDALSSVQHTVPSHATTLYAGVLAGGLKNRKGVFARIAKQDELYLNNKRQSLYNDYMYKYSKGLIKPEDVGGDVNSFLQQGQTQEEAIKSAFFDAANRQAVSIQRDHLVERSDTLKDGVNRSNVPFYYGYSVINNSSRMMITNDELNYQSDKLARFLVSGGMPSLFSISPKGGLAALDAAIKASKSGKPLKGESGFFRVLARSLILDADKLSATDQLTALKNELSQPNSAIRQHAMEVYNYREKNKAYTDAAKLAIANNQAVPQPEPFNPSEGLENFLSQHEENDTFYFALDALHELGAYDTVAKTARANNKPMKFASRVKAEVDGNSNGAVIQGYQMGVKNILERGGVLFQGEGDVEGDLREQVFRVMADNDTLEKDEYWESIFKVIGNDPRKIKKLMKVPIMTSIYGKDPAFHQDTAKKFIDDNPKMFEGLMVNGILSYEGTIKRLGEHLEQGLRVGLGGALEHSMLVKRSGRIFNFADEMMNIVGANGFVVQAGGIEYLPVDPRIAFPQGQQPFADYAPNTARVTYGQALKAERGFRGRQAADIQVTKAVSSPSARAKRRYVGEGEYSNPDPGSKLRNQAAVNLTQNIDATVAQRTVTRVIGAAVTPTVMQVYDAFMGDANSFDTLAKTANDVFEEVNSDGPKGFNMLEAEYSVFKDLLKQMKERVDNAKVSGDTFNIGVNGKYKILSDFLSIGPNGKTRMGAIMNRDMPDGDPNGSPRDRRRAAAKDKAMKAINDIRSEAIKYGYFPGKENVPLTAVQFESLFFKIVAAMNVDAEFKEMISEVNTRRKEIAQERKRKEQYS